MKILTNIISLFFLLSCSNPKTEKSNSQASFNETLSDSIKKDSIESNISSGIGEPFLISKIEMFEFTSGGGNKIKTHKDCDTSSAGFYGSYYIIDKKYKDEIGRPIGAIITIYSNKKMSKWKASDKDQTIWEIHLKSDIISLWDSIKVGMIRNDIEKFGEANNAICIKKGDNNYLCEFQKFSLNYIFKNDTLREIIATRKCIK